MSPPPNTPPHPPEFTLRALNRRAAVDLWIKAFGTAAGMGAFFALYFALMRHPAYPVAVMPATWLDRLVPFQPWTLVPYFSLWLYVSLLPAFLIDRRQLRSFALGSLGLSLAGCAVFHFFPTSIAAPEIDWSRHPSFEFLKTVDLAGNACPSLHAAFAVFVALWFERVLPSLGAGGRARALNLAWAALIVYSTLGTRQHVALDALWGAALGAVAASLNFLATPCREPFSATPRPLFLAIAIIKTCAVLLWTSGSSPAGCLALFFGAGALGLWHLFAPNAQGLVRVFTRFRPSAPTAREVWLTIDDGPDPDDTPRILDLLEKHRARATFFVVGERAERHTALVSEIQRRGHEVARHTRAHPMGGLWLHSPSRLAAELDHAPAHAARFRPPIGIKNLFLARALAARGLVCVGWSVRGRDSFSRDPEAVAARVLRRLRPGSIVLMHEGPFLRPAVRVEAIRLVVERASALGWRFVIPAQTDLV